MAKDEKSRWKSDIRIKPEGGRKKAPTVDLRACARPDCSNEGTHKVPKSRESLGEHLWLCLKHARAHNESWDYFNGMSDADIVNFKEEALTGHRPTWPMGKRGSQSRRYRTNVHEYEDDYGVFDDAKEPNQPRRPQRQRTKLQIQALETMNLDVNATLHEIKARYKELVKRFHPDANGGDRGAEERLKQVIKAYAVLKASGQT